MDEKEVIGCIIANLDAPAAPCDGAKTERPSIGLKRATTEAMATNAIRSGNT